MEYKMSEIEIAEEVTTAVEAKVKHRIGQYIACRNAIKAKNEAHDAEMKPLVDLSNMLTGWIQNFLDTAGVDNVKTSQGTAYSSTRYTASLADPAIFMDFVKKNNLYDLLDRKANVTAVKDYVEEHKVLPPGVNLSAIKTVGVRAPTRKT
jgi:hypothetical protein